MNNNKYFLAARDREVIEAGGFFCEACLVGKPLDDQSPAPRYCQGCFGFLKAEVELLSAKHKRPGWVPVPGRTEALPAKKEVVTKIADKGVGTSGNYVTASRAA